MDSNIFMDKIRAEAEKVNVNMLENQEAQDIFKAKNDFTGFNMNAEIKENNTCLHIFKPPKNQKKDEMETAMDAIANSIILAMSEANISTIDLDILGPIVSFSGLTPKGFLLFNPEYLDRHFYVLEHSNRIYTVHRIIEEKYNETDSTVIALPLIHKTDLYISVLGNRKKVEAEYLLFSEEEIFNISLPYVKEVRIDTDGYKYFYMIEVTR